MLHRHKCVGSLGSLNDGGPTPISLRLSSVLCRALKSETNSPITKAKVLTLEEDLADGPDGELGRELQTPDTDLLEPLVVHVVRGDMVRQGSVHLVRGCVEQAGYREARGGNGRKSADDKEATGPAQRRPTFPGCPRAVELGQV